ncbi:MAG: GIY-YIG nuclease family protein [Promethearchaeota archaeon]|jgi:hypothetical protein
MFVKRDNNSRMDKDETKPYGYIYVATNRVNGKVYVGQTLTSRWGDDKIPIEERWNNEIKDAYSKKSKGEKLRYVENAIIKYGEDNFDLKEVDTANDQEELNTKERKWIKDLDAMNPDKGYNMTEGGEGGEISPELKEYLSKVGSEKWQNDSDYRERQTQERRERAKNPEWMETMVNVNQEIVRNPETVKKISESLSAKWKEKEYQENVSNGVTDKWQEIKYRMRQFTARREGKREIPDKGEFLKDILDIKKKVLVKKYDMDGKTMNKRIEEILGHHGVKNYVQAKVYLKDKDLDEVLKDIKEKQIEQPQNFQGKKEILNLREFLEDIQNLKSKEIAQKYEMNRSTVNKRIREMLGDHGVKNYMEAKKYLNDKNLDEVIKDINERTGDQTQRFEGKSVIENKREFLEDIQNLQKNEIDHKYGMDAKTINNKIKGMLGVHGVKNYIEAKKFLKEKNLDDVVKEIEEREAEKEGEKSETEKGSEKPENETNETHPEEENPSSEEIGENDREEKSDDPEEKPLEEPLSENERVSDDNQSPEVAEESTEATDGNSSDANLSKIMPGIGVNYKDLIDDKREFLNDIKKGMTTFEIFGKYKIDPSTLNLVISDMFGEKGPNSYKGLYYDLQNKDIDEVLDDIKKRLKVIY